MTKDGQGRYILGEPASMPPRTLWDTPIATSLAMLQGNFMVGSFALAAQIYDRMEMEILASTEDADNFQRNLVTIRGEKRLALAVKIPAAIIYGALP